MLGGLFETALAETLIQRICATVFQKYSAKCNNLIVESHDGNIYDDCSCYYDYCDMKGDIC